MESRREVAQERMPASAALARRALPATRDARAGSPPWRVPERTSSSQTPAGCAVLPTLPAESQAGQPAPQDWYRCGARSECYHGVPGNKTKASTCISSPYRLHNPIPAVGRIGGAVHLLSGGAEISAAPVEPVHGVLYQGHDFSRA